MGLLWQPISGMVNKSESSAADWDGPHPYYYPELNMELLLPDTEPAKCVVFGCGHSLTLQERLFGNICQRHFEHFHFNDFIGDFEFIK